MTRSWMTIMSACASRMRAKVVSRELPRRRLRWPAIPPCTLAPAISPPSSTRLTGGQVAIWPCTASCSMAGVTQTMRCRELRLAEPAPATPSRGTSSYGDSLSPPLPPQEHLEREQRPDRLPGWPRGRREGPRGASGPAARRTRVGRLMISAGSRSSAAALGPVQAETRNCPGSVQLCPSFCMGSVQQRPPFCPGSVQRSARTARVGGL